jgi:hypothetical protein
MLTLPVERLRELFEYCSKTGNLFWKVDASTRAKVGSKAGCISENSCIRIGLDGKYYMAHRIVWALHTGEFPSQQIDHINGNPLDNRIENLRLATTQQNGENRRHAQRNNRSGLLGVCEVNGRWKATIWVKGIARHLGYFSDKETAHNEYLSAKRNLHRFCTI